MRRTEHGGDIYANPGVTLDFSVNTNPLGMPEAVRAALLHHAEDFSRYPDDECRELRAAIARGEGVPESRVLCGAGAADLIYRLCYALRPQSALVCAPTFAEYEAALAQAGCRAEHHALHERDDFALDADFIERIRPGVGAVFLCHPNNPTGRLIKPDILEGIIARARACGTPVIVDECFLDFTRGASCKALLSQNPGLMILRAFTKMYAIAGLRLGYMLCADADFLGKVSLAGPCWNVSSPAQAAGIAALACEGWAERTRRLIETERAYLAQGLRALGIRVFPGDANFLLLKSPAELYKPLLRKGILIRRCENFRGLDGAFYRVGVRTRAENAILLRELADVIPCCVQAGDDKRNTNYMA